MTADTAKPSPEALAEQESKNAFLQRLDDLSQEMIDAHGEDFTMGVLILGRGISRRGRLSRRVRLRRSERVNAPASRNA